VPSFAPPGQDGLAESPQVSDFLARCCHESRFSAFIYGYWPVSGHGHEKAENDLRSPRFTSSFDLLPYHIGSLVPGPMQNCVLSSGTPSLVQIFAEIEASTGRKRE